MMMITMAYSITFFKKNMHALLQLKINLSITLITTEARKNKVILQILLLYAKNTKIMINGYSVSPLKQVGNVILRL